MRLGLSRGTRGPIERGSIFSRNSNPPLEKTNFSRLNGNHLAFYHTWMFSCFWLLCFDNSSSSGHPPCGAALRRLEIGCSTVRQRKGFPYRIEHRTSSSGQTCVGLIVKLEGLVECAGHELMSFESVVNFSNDRLVFLQYFCHQRWNISRALGEFWNLAGWDD